MNSNIKKNRKTKSKKTRKQLLANCGLPDIPETLHCFADTTHHTCCRLGLQSRKYADNSGNPIGQLSVNVSKYNKNKKKTSKNDLTSWCTCTGSGVCSYYTKQFGKQDGTHIKFIGNLKTKDETKAISKLKLLQHRTPGIL